MAKKEVYGNESIKALKGADRVRKRPAVIFGSDGVEGCAHSIFEIISNSIDEARDGHGDRINVTLFDDHSVEVEDFGRGIPVDFSLYRPAYRFGCALAAGYRGLYRYRSQSRYLPGYAAPPGHRQRRRDPYFQRSIG